MAQKTFFIVFWRAFIEVTKTNFGESPILTKTHSPSKIRRSYDSQKETLQRKKQPNVLCIIITLN